MRQFTNKPLTGLPTTPHKLRMADKIWRAASRAKKRKDLEARENYRRMIGLKDSA